jgi:hypothetical protein
MMLEVEKDDQVVFHDPEGMPFSRRSLAALAGAAVSDQPSGIIPLVTQSRVAAVDIQQAAIVQMKRARKLAKLDKYGGSAGLRALANALISRRLVGSARSALDLALAQRGRAIAQIRNLLGPDFANTAGLGCYSMDCARARFALGNNSLRSLIDALLAAAVDEDVLDDATAKLSDAAR